MSRRIGTRDAIARVWVQPDSSTSGQGEWAFWFDTVLFPVDGVASLVWSLSGEDGNPTRTRGPRLLALPTRIAAVLLPCITVCPELYQGGDPARVVLGLYWEGGPLERVSVPEGASVAELRRRSSIRCAVSRPRPADPLSLPECTPSSSHHLAADIATDRTSAAHNGNRLPNVSAASMRGPGPSSCQLLFAELLRGPGALAPAPPNTADSAGFHSHSCRLWVRARCMMRSVRPGAAN